MAAVAVLSSCTKKEDSSSNPTPTPATNSVSLYFQPVAGTSTATIKYGLQNGRPAYVNANGDSIAINYTRYWVSAVEFVKTDGSVYRPDSSYHLIQQGTGLDTKLEFEYKRVPAGTYSRVRFRIGVDSALNVTGTNLMGDLAVGIGMNWNWNTGFIFLKQEGQFKDTDGTMKDYKYHVGNPPRTPRVAWNSATSNWKLIDLALPGNMTIGSNGAELHLHANILAPFGDAGQPGLQNVKTNSIVMVNPTANTIDVMNNVQRSMFKVDHIH